MENVGCKVIVYGIVQCVGFRYFSCIEAHKYSLTGHAKNLQCGDVEVLMYGEKSNIDKMLKWLEEGPKTARVENLTSTDIPYEVHKGFISL